MLSWEKMYVCDLLLSRSGQWVKSSLHNEVQILFEFKMMEWNDFPRRRRWNIRYVVPSGGGVGGLGLNKKDTFRNTQTHTHTGISVCCWCCSSLLCTQPMSRALSKWSTPPDGDCLEDNRPALKQTPPTDSPRSLSYRHTHIHTHTLCFTSVSHSRSTGEIAHSNFILTFLSYFSEDLPQVENVCLYISSLFMSVDFSLFRMWCYFKSFSSTN